MRPKRAWFQANRIGGEDVLASAEQERKGLRQRAHRVYLTSPLVAQSALATGASWAAASAVVPVQQGFFAPVIALIVIASSLTQRFSRTLQLLFGVLIGLFLGDALVFLLGSGPVQVSLVVALAMAAAVFLGGGAALIVQAGATAILVVTIAPPHVGIYLPRLIDALLGSGIGLLVTTLLFPLHPVRLARRATDGLAEEFIVVLHEIAAALRSVDPHRAEGALARAESTRQRLRSYETALDVATETASAAPIRWHMQEHIVLYLHTRPYMVRVLAESWTLARRVIDMTREGESFSPAMPVMIDQLAAAVGTLRDELARGRSLEASRAALRDTVRRSAGYWDGVATLSQQVVVAQVRSTVVDLLRATGLAREDAERMANSALERPTEFGLRPPRADLGRMAAHTTGNTSHLPKIGARFLPRMCGSLVRCRVSSC